jgi:hypothetical protein
LHRSVSKRMNLLFILTQARLSGETASIIAS